MAIRAYFGDDAIDGAHCQCLLFAPKHAAEQSRGANQRLTTRKKGTIMHQLIFRTLIFCAFVLPLFAQLKPALNRPIVEGQKKILATVHQAGEWTVKLLDNGREVAAKSQSVGGDEAGLITFDFGNEGSVSEGVKKGWEVTLFLGEVQKASVPVQPNTVKIFLHQPKEGDQVVKGTVLGTANQVRVEVFSARGTPVDLDTASVSNGGTDNPGKHFTAGMNRRLAAGQTVRITALKDDAEVGAMTDFAMVETAGFDWGRVRSYFSAGVTIAHEDTTTTTDNVATRDRKFQSADYFVSMAVDYNWLSSLHDRFASPCLRSAKSVEELKQLEDLVDRWDGRDFDKRIGKLGDPEVADSRLTALIGQFRDVLEKVTKDLEAANQGENCLAMERTRIQILKGATDSLPRKGVAEVEQYVKALSGRNETGASLDSAKDTASRALQAKIERFKRAIGQLDKDLEEFRKGDPTAPRGGRLFNTSFEARLGQAPVVGAASAAAPASILQNSNSGYVGMDFYAPWWPQSTSWRFKDRDNALFLAPLARLGLLATTNGPVKVVEGAEKPELFRHLYASHSYGLRFGHFGLDPRGSSVAPELISFLDVTAGKFDNFRMIAGEAPSITDRVHWRTEFHGRFKIPETPFYVGFTANLGRGKDDMRFFFGTRFDVSKVLSKLVSAVD